MTDQTFAAEEEARHAELANQDEASAISDQEPLSLLRRLIASLAALVAH